MESCPSWPKEHDWKSCVFILLKIVRPTTYILCFKKEKNTICSGFGFFVKNLKKSDLLINLVSCFFSLLTTNRVILSEKEV